MRPSLTTMLIAVAALSGCAPPGSLQPAKSANMLDWSNMDSAQPAKSNSPWTAYLDTGVVVLPTDDVPPAVRPLSGRWQGWIGRNRSGSVAVEIARMNARTASGRYSYAGIDNVNGSLSPVRVFALNCTVANEAYLDCDVTRSGLIGLKVFIKARSDNVAMIRYTGNQGRGFAWGVMERE